MAKILIVDDEKQMAEFMKLSLERQGYEIMVASTGQEALDIYPKENPKMVLLDLGLPDMDGRDVLKEIKAKSPQIKVVIITGYKDSDTKRELNQLGADYFLGKPLSLLQLHELLKNVF